MTLIEEKLNIAKSDPLLSFLYNFEIFAQFEYPVTNTILLI